MLKRLKYLRWITQGMFLEKPREPEKAVARKEPSWSLSRWPPSALLSFPSVSLSAIRFHILHSLTVGEQQNQAFYFDFPQYCWWQYCMMDDVLYLSLSSWIQSWPWSSLNQVLFWFPLALLATSLFADWQWSKLCFEFELNSVFAFACISSDVIIFSKS